MSEQNDDQEIEQQSLNEYMCNYCNKRFIDKKLFNTHIKTEKRKILDKNNKESQRYKCDFCLRCFSRSEHLLCHLRSCKSKHV